MNTVFLSIADSRPIVGNLSKGLIEDSFNNSESKFSKNGKEIKQKISSIIPILEGKVTSKLSEVKSNLSLCGDKVPLDVVDSYYTRGYEIENLPKLFKWEQVKDCYSTQETSGYDSSIKETVSPNCCEVYNNSVRELVSICVDLLTLKTLHSSIKDSEVLNLSLRQLRAIGF